MRPGEVLEMNVKDMTVEVKRGEHTPSGGGKIQQGFLFAYPMPFKKALGVGRKLVDLMLTFGVPMSVRSSAGGGGVTAEVVDPFYRWLWVLMDFGPQDRPRVQGAAERM